ncbi:malate dehydrogenase, partial [Paenibacillus jamilae]
NGTKFEIGQANNAFVFPGLGLGAIVVKAKRITPSMFTAAADSVANAVDSNELGGALLPHIQKLRDVSFAVAVAVAKAAIQDQVAQAHISDIEQAIRDAMWKPEYVRVKAVESVIQHPHNP